LNASADSAEDGLLSPAIRSVFKTAGDDFSCLLIAANDISAAADKLRNDLDITVVREWDRLDTLPDRRFDLAVVAGFPEACSHAGEASVLLARLRDCYAVRVIIVDDAGILTLADYLALGFEGWDTEGESRCFIYDPDSRTLKREWNDARHWANPENFDRYRW